VALEVDADANADVTVCGKVLRGTEEEVVGAGAETTRGRAVPFSVAPGGGPETDVDLLAVMDRASRLALTLRSSAERSLGHSQLGSGNWLLANRDSAGSPFRPSSTFL
jgi:hypothetical protein